VKVTIPKAALSGTEAYGFSLAMGWHDPDRSQAAKVKICKIRINTLAMRLTDRDAPAEKLRQVFKDHQDELEKQVDKELVRQAAKFRIDIPAPFNIHIDPLNDIPGLHDFIKAKVKDILTFFINTLVGLVPSESEEEWLFRMGVNGVWICRFFSPNKPDFKQDPNKPHSQPSDNPHQFGAFDIQFREFVADGDPLFFASHGSEFDPVGDIMHSASDKRTLKLPFPSNTGSNVPWNKIVHPDTPEDRKQLVYEFVNKEMFDTTGGFTKLSLGFDNSPLGIIDPDPATAGTAVQNNPMKVTNAFKETTVVRQANFARATDDMQILVEDTSKPDYKITYFIEVTDLISKT
jgi:hypothetical protein